MYFFRIAFSCCLLWFSTIIYPRVDISEIINESWQVVQLAYPSRQQVKVISSKSIETGELSADKVKFDGKNTIITIPAKAIAFLESASFPEYDGTAKSCIYVGFGTWASSLNHQLPEGAKDGLTLIYKKKDLAELVPIMDGHQDFFSAKILKTRFIEGEKYILQINNLGNFEIYPRTDERLAPYINPGKLSFKELLHQAVINDSIDDIKNALKLGADVNVGIANQPPLLFALLTKKYKAVKELLANGANPNIVYSNEPLFYQLFGEWRTDLMLEFLRHGLKLSDNERTWVIDKIMFHFPSQLNENMVQVLSSLNYDIRKNFDDTDLSKNKWYNLLMHHYTGTKQGVQFGHAGMPNLDMVELYLKYGANPSQTFIASSTISWNPILLTIDNFIQSIDDKGKINNSYQDSTLKTLKVLLKAGADINRMEKPDGNEESPLSYVLKKVPRVPLDIIEFLVDSGASLEDAVRLFLKNGGSPNLKLFFGNTEARTFSGKSLLLWVVEKNNLVAARLLLKAGVYKQHRDEALKVAISKRYEKIIELLMS